MRRNVIETPLIHWRWHFRSYARQSSG